MHDIDLDVQFRKNGKDLTHVNFRNKSIISHFTGDQALIILEHDQRRNFINVAFMNFCTSQRGVVKVFNKSRNALRGERFNSFRMDNGCAIIRHLSGFLKR